MLVRHFVKENYVFQTRDHTFTVEVYDEEIRVELLCDNQMRGICWITVSEVLPNGMYGEGYMVKMHHAFDRSGEQYHANLHVCFSNNCDAEKINLPKALNEQTKRNFTLKRNAAVKPHVINGGMGVVIYNSYQIVDDKVRECVIQIDIETRI